MDKYTTVVKHANSLTVDEYNLALDLGAKNSRTEQCLMFQFLPVTEILLKDLWFTKVRTMGPNKGK